MHQSLTHRSLEALLDFVEQANKISGLEDTIWHLAHHTIKALNFEDCVIYLLSDDGDTLEQVAAFGNKNPERFEILNPIQIKIGKGIVGKAAAQKSSLLIEDTRQQADYIVDDQPRLSELAVPILFHGHLLGVIDSEHSQANFFTADHQRYVEILSSVLASKITSETSIQKLQHHIQAQQKSQNLVEAYLQISELSYSSISIEDFYLNLHKVIARQINTHSFYVMLFDTQTLEASCPFIHDQNNGSEFSPNIDQVEMKDSLILSVIKEQIPRLINNKELNLSPNNFKFVLTHTKIFSWLAVPFKVDGSLKGAIALQSYHRDVVFNDDDKEFVTFLGQHIATAIKQKLKDQKLHYQALHDSVTGLANRTLFLDRIAHAFLLSRRHQQPDLAVLFIDFDDFKLINDNFGHQAGDIVLRVTAQRITAQLRAEDTLARLGGDEFAILLESIESVSYAIAVGQRVLAAMKPSIKVGQQTIYASISIGIGLNDQNCDCAEDLLKNADHAMYYAKERGKNNIQVYEERLHQAVIYARQIVKELEFAIDNNQLVFYYQPIVDLDSNAVAGFEALIRWVHPTRGVIPPDEFIQIAEQHDLIKKIDHLLLESVAEQLSRWSKISAKKIYISINISSQRFIDASLVDEIKQAIHKYKLSAGTIVVEVTEHILMDNINKARLLFHKLKLLGVKISLDDFGTGYSSLSYLHRLPFDIIKIDRSFVTHIQQSNPEYPIINTIVALAKTLNMEIVAEGIETLTQYRVLKAIGCSYGQGYYFEKPVPYQKATKLVTSGKIKLSA